MIQDEEQNGPSTPRGKDSGKGAPQRPDAERPKVERRGGPPRAIAALVGRVTRASLRKQGFTEAAIIAEWASVVGPELAAACVPEKLTYPRSGESKGSEAKGARGGATLTVRCAHGPFATMLQHREPLIVERINGYFGYHAVARLKMVQGPLPLKAAPKRQPPRPLTTAERDRLDTTLADVADDELRAALERLGRAVLSTDGAA